MEITEVISKNHPNLKQKLEDLALYIKVSPKQILFFLISNFIYRVENPKTSIMKTK
jgi:hypothetical protein